MFPCELGRARTFLGVVLGGGVWWIGMDGIGLVRMGSATLGGLLC